MKGVLAFFVFSIIYVGTTVLGNDVKPYKYTTKDHNKIVGCYWGTWAYYRQNINGRINAKYTLKNINEIVFTTKITLYTFRPGYGKFDIANIDPNLCTHGFYGFADLNNRTEDPHAWELVAYDPWYVYCCIILKNNMIMVTLMMI